MCAREMNTFSFIQQYLLNAFCYDLKFGPQNSCIEALTLDMMIGDGALAR